MTIFVGNIPYIVNEDEIREAFEQIAPVKRVQLIVDRETGRSKGYAFIEMEDEAALKAIREFDGATWGGRELAVNVAKPREVRTT